MAHDAKSLEKSRVTAHLRIVPQMSPNRDFGKEIDELRRELRAVDQRIDLVKSELTKQVGDGFAGVDRHLQQAIPAAVDAAFAPLQADMTTIRGTLTALLASNKHQTTLLEATAKAKAQIREESGQHRALVVESLELAGVAVGVENKRVDTETKAEIVIDARISGARTRRNALIVVAISSGSLLLIALLNMILSHLPKFPKL